MGSGSGICMCVSFSTYMWLSKLSTFFDGGGGGVGGGEWGPTSLCAIH